MPPGNDGFAANSALGRFFCPFPDAVLDVAIEVLIP